MTPFETHTGEEARAAMAPGGANRLLLLGGWDLVAATWSHSRMTEVDGGTLGGALVHLADGTFSLHINTPGGRTYVSAHGLFLLERRGRLSHRIEGSTIDHWIGTTRVHDAVLSEHGLVLEAVPPSTELVRTIWER